MKTLSKCAEEIAAIPEFNWTEKYFENAAEFLYHKEGGKPKSGSPNVLVSELNQLVSLGCKGEDVDGNINFLFFDIDVGHGNNPCKTKQEAIEEGYRLRKFFQGRADIHLSKSGQGVHVLHRITGCKIPYPMAPLLTKGIAKHLNLKCDTTPLGRQSVWLWTRDLSPCSFTPIEDQEQGNGTLKSYEKMLAMFNSTNTTVVNTKPIPTISATKPASEQTHPAARYKREHTCREWLEIKGWKLCGTGVNHTNGLEQKHYTRPGKDSGISGNITLHKDGYELFKCFTSSDPILSATGGDGTGVYNAYELYSAYEHNGNEEEAFETLKEFYKKETDQQNEEKFKFANKFLDQLLGTATVQLQPNTDGWEIRSVRKTVRENTIVRPKILIEGVCYRGGKISISAPSKGRKTFTLMHLAYCVATGTDWMGHKVNQGKVLYVNLELMDFSFFDRGRAIERNMGLNPNDTGFDEELHEVNLRGKMVTIEAMQKFFKDKKPENYSLIIVDPLYKILGRRSENDASEMGDLLNRLENIASNAGASLAVAHHFAKGNAAGKEIIDRSSGSGVIARDGDTIISLTPHEEEDCFTMDFVVRDFEPVAPRVLRWQYPYFRADASLDPQNLKLPKGKMKAGPLSIEDLEGAIQDCLENTPEPKSIEEITLKVGHVHRTRTLIGLMVKTGKVITQDVQKGGMGRPTKLYTLKRDE